jgi:carboxynorspermidine decarboxylase
VLDVALERHAGRITDISATCHMPDVIEAPYRPAMLGELPLEDEISTIAGRRRAAGRAIVPRRAT